MNTVAKKDTVAEFEERMRRQIDGEINDLHANFARNVAADRPVLPEHIFREYFLPFFAGKRPAAEGFMNEWIAIARSPMGSVTIIDTYGQALFTVPPLYSTNFLRVGQQLRAASFASIFESARQQANRIPRLGTIAVATAVEARYGNDLKTEPVPADTQVWHDIFVRYGYVVDQHQQGTGAYLANNGQLDAGELDW